MCTRTRGLRLFFRHWSKEEEEEEEEQRATYRAADGVAAV